MMPFDREFDRLFKSILILAAFGIPCIVVVAIQVILWLFRHVRLA